MFLLFFIIVHVTIPPKQAVDVMRFIGAYYTIFSHDGEGAEVAEEAVLEDAVAEES